jgi:arabinofuranosyltransferase
MASVLSRIQSRPMASRRAVASVWVGAIALTLLLAWLHRAFLHDDALISLRYARHLVEGLGLRWNPGEPPVEGYTNFLFVAAVAGLAAMGADLVAAARLLGLAGVVAAAVAVAVHLRRSEPQDPWAPAAGVAWTLASSSLLAWAWGGLEVAFLAGLVAVATVAALHAARPQARARDAGVAGVLYGLAVLTRPDAALLVALAVGYLAWQRGGRAVWLALGAAALVAPHAAWRWAYYGDWVPNTFHAKLTGLGTPLLLPGLDYAARWALTPPFVPLAAAAAGALALRHRRRRPHVLFVLASVAAFLAYVVAAGGDHMPAFRLVAPLVPLAGLLLGWGVGASPAITRRPALAAAALLAPLALQAVRPFPVREDPAAFVGTIVGRHLAAAWPEGSLVALHTAGSTPYAAPRHRFLDMLGLNDRHIARRRIDRARLPWQHRPGHGKGDGAYVLAREPDYVILGPAEGTTASQPLFLSDLELAEDPRFDAMYARCVETLDVSGVPGHELYRSTRSGSLRFTYYRRKRGSPSPPHCT